MNYRKNEERARLIFFFEFLLLQNHRCKFCLMIKSLFLDKPVSFVKILTCCIIIYMTSAAEWLFQVFARIPSQLSLLNIFWSKLTLQAARLNLNPNLCIPTSVVFPGDN